MKKIKALIYREWLLTRRSTLFGMIAVFSIFMLFVLIALSAKYGNLKNEFSGDDDAVRAVVDMFTFTFAYLMIYCVITIAAECQVYKEDIGAGWTRYALALPADAAERSLAHTIYMLIRLTAGYLLIFAIQGITAAMTGTALGAENVTDIGITTCFVLLFVLAQEFFASRAKDSISFRKQGNYLLIIFISSGAVIGFILSKYFGGENSDLMAFLRSFRSAAQPFVLPCMILMIVLIFVSVKHNIELQKRT